MKGLRMVLTPFAPDQSGAVSVLYEMGGLIVILDAGGCTGNICGFDEPRWQIKKSQIMSAALRDMDAILGRDKLLVEKVVKAAHVLNPRFIALIGTPIPAVIGTDMNGLSRLIKKELNNECEVFGIPTFGMKYYDEGASDAYVTLVKKFILTNSENESDSDKEYIGVWGAIPLDINKTDSDSLKNYILKMHQNTENIDKSSILCFGLGDGMDAVKKASFVKKNIVISRCAIKAAKILKDECGIEYETFNPLVYEYENEIKESIRDITDSANEKKDINILIVSEQIAGISFRKIIREYVESEGLDIYLNIKVCGYFGFEENLCEEGDEKFYEEDDFTEELKNNDYDIIICDPVFKDLADYDFVRGTNVKKWIDAVHFAISGQM